MPETVKTNYCYQCGRHIGHQSQACWYCGTAARRVVRPERRCPFCDEAISPKAVKCPHCGEFVDGRGEAKPGDVGVQANALMFDPRLPPPHGAAPGYALPAPSRPGLAAPQPAPGARALEGQRRLAIEDASAQKDRGRAPTGDPDTLDVEFSSKSLSGSAKMSSPPSRALPTPGGGESRALAPRGRSQGALAPALRKSAAVGLPILRSAFRAAMRLLRRKPGQKPEDAIDVAIEDPEARFMRCPACSTECLASDNYCFHCGGPFAASPFGHGDRIDTPLRSNIPVHALVIACLGLYVFADALLKAKKPEAILPAQAAGGALAMLLSAWAVARKPGFFSRFFSIVVFIFSLLVLYVFNPFAPK